MTEGFFSDTDTVPDVPSNFVIPAISRPVAIKVRAVSIRFSIRFLRSARVDAVALIARTMAASNASWSSSMFRISSRLVSPSGSRFAA